MKHSSVRQLLNMIYRKFIAGWTCLALALFVGAQARASLPDGWTDADIGSPSQPGSAICVGTVWTVSGGGADIGGASDQYHFASTSVSGDQSVVARVTSVGGTDSGAKAGVMFRASATATAMFVAVVVTPGSGVWMEWRSATAADCGSTSITGAAPVWVRLVRSGNTFTGYYSGDGAVWIQIGTVNVSMTTAVRVGLAVTAHNDSLLCQAGFSDVSVSGTGVTTSGPKCGVYREMYTGLNFGGGNTIASFTNSASFPNSPNKSYTKVFSAFEAEMNTGIDNYGQRLRAYLLPPVDGDYTFWISSDDASQLFLSTDENPANKYVIASVNNWTSSRVWSTEANQQSSTISLKAGQRYYIEALMQQGGGLDNLAVRWQWPDGTYEEPIPAATGAGPRMLPVDGTVTRPSIYSQTTTLTVVEGNPARMSVLATNASALTYQWWAGGVTLAKATNPVYTLSSVSMSDSNKYFFCVASNSMGMVTSAPVVLTVVADRVPPAIARVLNLGLTNVQVVFTKTVEAVSATAVTNYTLSDGVTVSRAALGPDNMTVTLTTSPLTMWSNYVLQVSHVRDRATTPNTMEPDATITFTALPLATVNIGGAAAASSFSSTNGVMSVSTSGYDIGGTADQCAFSYQMRTGDFDLSLQLSGLVASDAWAKAGLMARESLDMNCRFAATLATPSICGAFFESRSGVASQAASSKSFPVNYPNTWLRLKRVGNVFTGYASYDGQTWTQLDSVTMPLASQLYVGVAVSSHSTSRATTARFGDITEMRGNVVLGTAENPREALGPSSRKTPIVISEIMYKPAARADGANVEFIEIYNSNPYFHDIGGYKLTGAVDYTFPANTILQGGAFMVVAAVPSDMERVYGISGVCGPYTGSLKKSGELQLLDEQGAVLLTVPYSNVTPWPVAATGTGHSIVLANPTYGEGDPRAWEISTLMGGSPGNLDPFYPTTLSTVKINEILAHTEDVSISDSIELYNHSTQTNDLSGCILTDDPNTDRFVIPAGTTISPRGYAVFDQTTLGFGLSAKGGTLYLIDPGHTRVLDALQYEAQADGVSFGRYPDGADDCYPLVARTPGASNSAPLVRDIVINELMYDPISGDDDDQYIELYNKGTNTVNLSGWQFVSGVTFTFPGNARIAPDGYVVVARNLDNILSKYTNLTSANTFGGYSGKLSHNGDRVALAMPQPLTATDTNGMLTTNTIYVVADEVTYGTGGRWGQWAAGGGSSLELMDPRANHRLASNWGDSDETGKSSWTNIETTGVLDNGANFDTSIDFVAIGLLDVGECLVDNIEVNYNNKNFVSNSTFETGTNGWYFEGCHARSLWEKSGYSSSSSLHIRSSGRIWTGANACSTYLNSTTLQEGYTVTLRYKARWQRGWPEPLMRLSGNWLEATGTLPVPQNLGTPGAANSRATTHSGPAMYQVTHTPSLPAAGQAAVVTAKVDDPDGVKNLVLYYRIDPATAYTAVLMKDDGAGGDAIAGDGVFSARIPGQSAGSLAAFYIVSTDMPGNSTRFPALLTDGTPTREALILFGDNHDGGGYGVYHLWVSQASAARWSSMPNLSNEAHDSTMVCGKRVIYNTLARYTGSPYHQNFDTPYGSLCHYKWIFPDDDKFLGATSFNKLHQPGNGAGDDASLQREQIANSFLRALGEPWLYRRHVMVFVNGNQRGQLMEDAQTPDADVVKEHFPNDKNGYLYKMQPWFEFGINNTGNYCNFNMPSWCNIMPYTTTGGVKKAARYRWNFMVRRTADSANNFTNVYRVVDAASSYGTTNFASRMKSVANMENWMRVFAANHAAGNWDSFGSENAQNMYGYAGADGTKYTLLMFDFNISIGNSGSWGGGENLFTLNGSDSNTQNIYNEPEFRRMYWRALGELVDGPLDVSKSGPLIDAKYAALTANGFTVENTTAIKSWLTAAHDSIASQLAAANANAFAVSSTVVNNDVAYIAGVAPVSVKSIWINGVEYPVYWNSVQGWSAAVPLSAGTNILCITGVDMHGTQVAGASNSVTVTPLVAPSSPVGKVMINEIMYDPAIAGAAYVELYNASSNTSYDLSGFEFRGLAYTFPPGSFIAPQSYLVLAADRMAFASVYGTTIPVFDTFDGTLQLDGETLSLIQPGTNGAPDTYVARVRYESVAPWPTNALGTGASLQLIDPAQDNWRVANWAAVGMNIHPEMKWVYATANIGSPASSSTTFYMYLRASGDVYIDDLTLVKNGATSSVLQNGGFESALSGSWGVNGNFSQSSISSSAKHAGASSLHIVATGGGSGSGNAIYQTVSGLDTSSTYVVGFWYLQSTNAETLTLRFSNRSSTELDQSVAAPGSGMTVCTPGTANSVADTVAGFQPLWINEVQAENVTGPTNAAGQRTGWIEIHNPGTNSVSVNGLYLAGQYTNLTQWAFPTNGVIPPGGFKVVFVDGLTNLQTAEEWHAGFALPGGAGVIALSRMGAETPEVLDYLSYTNLHSNHSYGSFPDGQSFSRQEFYYVTPGAMNSGLSAPLTVSINEWMAGNTMTIRNPVGSKFDDWFELYNYGSNTVDLTGYYLTHSLTNQFEFKIPAGYTIPPGGFLLVWADKKTNTGTVDLHAGFKLSKSGTSIGLYGADGVAVDYVTFGAMVSDVSMGRYPDGGETISLLPQATPGTNNAAPFIVPGAPTSLTATPGDGQVALFWSPVLTATGYAVKRSSTDGGPYTTIAVSTVTNFIDTSVVNGTGYYYVVSATNQAGEGANSTQAAAVPKAVIPETPAGLAAVVGDARVALSWTASAGAVAYNVKRSTVEGGPYLTLGSPTDNSFIDTTVNNGVLYFYVVSAVNANGESADCKSVGAMPQVAAPLTPSGLAASVTNGSVTLGWNLVPGATGYSLKRSTSISGPYTAIYSGGDLEFTDTRVTDSTRYYYVVSATNAGGESPDSSPVGVTAQSQLILRVAALADGQLQLSWPAWATDYKVMSTPDLNAPNWQSVTNAVETVDGTFRVTLPAARTSAFFRLQK
jgi:regulation of enolase protein 1 (concanavalin A-like superfamily)